jgi:hypothetical protein
MPKACRDLVTSATLAFEDKADVDAQSEQKQNWKDIARNFWVKSAADTDAQTGKRKKLHRTKVYEWICATTHMLHIAMGVTWEYFIVDAAKQLSTNAKLWPCCTICIDQGSDGWSAVHFLTSLSANILILSIRITEHGMTFRLRSLTATSRMFAC